MMYFSGSLSSTSAPLSEASSALLRARTCQSIEDALAQGADINARDREGNTLLHHLAASDLVDAVKLLLSKGASFTTSPVVAHPHSRTNGREGWTAFHEACARGSSTVVQAFLEAGANPDTTSAPELPLHAAAAAGNITVVDLLLRSGANVNGVAPSGETALHAAARAQKLLCVALLLQSGADPNLASGDRTTPLHLVAYTCPPSFATAFLQHGAAVNARDHYERTPLHLAANELFVKELLAFGADVHIADEYGQTPLHEAVRRSPVVASLLINNGADVNAKTHKGDTILRYAIQARDSLMIRLLLHHGADASSITASEVDRSPHRQLLLMARNTSPSPLVGKLEDDILRVTVPARVDLQNELQTHIQKQAVQDMLVYHHNGSSVFDLMQRLSGGLDPKNLTELLISAVKAGSEASYIERLLAAGASPKCSSSRSNKPCADVVAPLHVIAAQLGMREHLQLLLHYGVDVTEADPNGYTALHMAVENQHIDCVFNLINAGAPLNVNECGMTPLHLAVKVHNPILVDMLIGAKADVHVVDVGQPWDRSRPPADAPGTKRAMLTPLSTAVQHSDLQSITSLLQAGADPNWRNSEGASHVSLASRHKDTAVLKLLVHYGGSLTVRDLSGNSLLHTAAQQPNALEMIEAVLSMMRASGPLPSDDAGICFLDWKNQKGETALHLATVAGNTEVVTLLLDAGADINAKNASDEYPLLISLSLYANYRKLSHSIIAQLLLQRGADIKGRSKTSNSTVLHAAARMGDAELVKEFLKRGLDVHAEDMFGNTPLHVATENPQGKLVVEVLLRHNADVLRRNKAGLRPKEKCAKQNVQIVDVLEQAERAAILGYGSYPPQPHAIINAIVGSAATAVVLSTLTTTAKGSSSPDEHIPHASEALGKPRTIKLEEIVFDEDDIGLRRKLGEGAFGVVYSAVYAGEPVAVKLLKNLSMEKMGPFLREATIQYHTKHKHVVSLLGMTCVEGDSAPVYDVFLVLERMKRSLADVLAGLAAFRGGAALLPRVPLYHRLRWVSEIAAAVRYMHAQHVVHADLKPGNILFEVVDFASPSRMSVKLADFGFARVMRMADASSISTMGPQGTPLYMDPCLWRPDARITKASDVYSLSMLLWEIVMLERPFRECASDLSRLIATVTGGQRPSAEAFVMKLMSEGMAEEDARELAEAMQQAWHGESDRRGTVEDLERKLRAVNKQHTAAA